MGIQGLTKLLGDKAPSCSKEQKFDSFFGRKIAIDASMHIYASMVVVGRVGDQLLQNEAGEVTSHLQGMFNRTVKLLEAGIKPVYVFDGKPPQLKLDQLATRTERRADANDALEKVGKAASWFEKKDLSNICNLLRRKRQVTRRGSRSSASALSRLPGSTTRSVNACCALWACLW
jgi:5'-3' exonuclease